MREMHADLMGTARLELHPQQRVCLETTLDAVVRHRLASVAAYGHPRALRAMTPDGLVDRATPGQRALTEREILALDIASGEHPHEFGVGNRRTRHDE